MRNLLTTFSLLVFLLPSLTEALKGVSTLKGVRGHKRLDSANRVLKDKDDKKCKKYAEPKGDLKAAAEPKATKAPKDQPEPKESLAEPKKESDDKSASDDKATKDKEAAKGEEELECLEWEDREDDGSSVISDPSMGSTGTSSEFDSVNVDCEAIANDSGPTDTHSVSFMVNIDVIKEDDAKQSDIYAAMEKELQQKVAPRIAGCSSGRMLEEEVTTKIVHVDFGEMEFDHQGCDSSLAKDAAEMDGVCMSSDVPVDVYFVGDFPDNAIAKVEVAIEEHVWDVDGLLKTSEVDIVQTSSSMGSEESALPVGAIAGGIAAAVALCVIGFCCYKRSQDPSVAKAELDTDAESSDDEKQKIPEVQARAVNGTN